LDANDFDYDALKSLESLFEAARRRAFSVDEAMDEILGDLNEPE